MPVHVVARITDVGSVVACYEAQLLLPDPVHVWFAVLRSVRVPAASKRRLHGLLESLVIRHGMSPFVQPPSNVHREAGNLQSVLARVLKPAPRRCFAARRGTFLNSQIEGGCSEATSPFEQPYFLVMSESILQGEGSFGQVLRTGSAVVRREDRFVGRGARKRSLDDRSALSHPKERAAAPPPRGGFPTHLSDGIEKMHTPAPRAPPLSTPGDGHRPAHRI